MTYFSFLFISKLSGKSKQVKQCFDLRGGILVLFRKKKLSNKQEDSNVRKAKYTPRI